VYIVSTCTPFIRTASSLATSVGLEPVVGAVQVQSSLPVALESAWFR
jgi:hypothetical protein